MLTIDVPAYDFTLLTIEEARVAIGLASNDTSQDTKLESLRTRISAAITKACKVAAASDGTTPTLREEEVTETFRFTCQQDGVFLGRAPIVEVSSVTEVGSALSASEYEVDGHGLYRLSGSERVQWAAGRIVVDYVCGWYTVPEDLRFAAVKFLQAEWAQGARDPLLKRHVTEGVGEREYWVDPTKDSIVPGEVMDLLDRGGYVNRWAWMR